MSGAGVGTGSDAARPDTGGPSGPAGVTPVQEPERKNRIIFGMIAAASAVSLFSAGALVGQLTGGQTPALAAARPAVSSTVTPSPPAVSEPVPTVTVTAAPSPTISFPAPDAAVAVQSVVDVGSPPVQVLIPDLGIDKRPIGLSVTPDRQLEIPESADDLGWWSDGPAPGDPGAALVVGHVDSTEGPGVFYHLSTLQEGAVVSVRQADGDVVRFAVTGTQVFAKNDFPDDLVYRTEGRSSLHLVTCGGTFDRETGHYRDNVVVFADLIEEEPEVASTPSPAQDTPAEDAPAEVLPAGVTAEEKASAEKMNAAIAEAVRRAAAGSTGTDVSSQDEAAGP